MKRTLPLIGLAIVLLLLILPPIFGSRYTVLMIAQVLVAASFAMSYNMLLGQTGMLSFGQAVFFQESLPSLLGELSYPLVYFLDLLEEVFKGGRSGSGKYL